MYDNKRGSDDSYLLCSEFDSSSSAGMDLRKVDRLDIAEGCSKFQLRRHYGGLLLRGFCQWQNVDHAKLGHGMF